jgi:putative transcriptional regulator
MAIRVTLEDQLKRNHMTSKELCEKVGITEANMSLLRTGSVKGIRFNTLNRICYYLHCDVEDILSFDGNLEVEDED